MRLVKREDIERWAEGVTAKSELPYVISLLVRSTTPGSTFLDVPSGTAIFVGGWDGVVNCQEDTPYTPKGISLFEFGTEDNNKGKANKDYNKRKANPLGYNPKECTFIFVTARFWRDKNKWVKDKKAEGFWKDVRVYDSSILEQWMALNQASARWFSSRMNVYPYDGIMTVDEFWEEFAIGPNGILLKPEVITAGREHEQKQLLNILQGAPVIKGVKASTKQEAIAFIIASAKNFQSSEADRFLSKTLIVDTEGNFRGLRINTTTPLNLIPRFEDMQPLYVAVSKGHHVLVPLGADDNFNQEIVSLPTIDRDGQVNALVKSNILQEDAEKFSKEAGRNITILRKLLGFPYSKAKWLTKENLREIIPALIIGRWNETFEGDIELIEKLSGQPYSEYQNILNRWKNFEEAPILQIGETWRLTSPLDLWTTIAPYLSDADFLGIKKCFLIAFKDGNPPIEPYESNEFSIFFSKKLKFSKWCREGLTQSLILISRFGGALKLLNLSNSQDWVDNIISELLFDASSDTWISVDNELPLISEASPISFLSALSHSLSKDDPEVVAMFKEEQGMIHSVSNHTGLLWALEGLAWLPDYLSEASMSLLKLARLDPGGNLQNRPINSLAEIFKPWHYQTLATYTERMDVLKYITEKEPQVGWTLLLRMLPDHHAIAQPTHKMRWRMFDKNANLTYTYKDIWDTHSYVIKLLLEQFDNSETKFAQILNEVGNISPYDRKIVLQWAEKVLSKIEQKEFTAWEAIRKILNHHRSHPKADWAMTNNDLASLENLYTKLEPKDVVHKYLWLFNDHWPAFIEGVPYDDEEYDERTKNQEMKIDQVRILAIGVFIESLGLKKTIELRKDVKEPWALGDAMAKVITEEDDVISICDSLNDTGWDARFIQSFIFRKSISEGFDWTKTLFKKLEQNGNSPQALSNILLPLRQSKELWDFIGSLSENIQAEYWQNMHPHFYPISSDELLLGIEALIKYKRFPSAIDISAHFVEKLPTKILVVLLQKAATEPASETTQLRGYEVEKIFAELDKRKDINHSTLISLEWLYLPLLDSYGTRRNPKALQLELSNNPDFFVEVLKWVYLPKNKDKINEERKGLSEESIRNRATHAYHLLHSWKQIPGMESDKSIDKEVLLNWIHKARKLAEEHDRIDVADMQIGQLLSNYPENVPQWPEETIFQVIEEINTDSLKKNYSVGMFNKRGSSTRGPFDGGDIERDKAAYFEKLYQDFKNKYPNVSRIFKKMAEGYLRDAKVMDDEAERSKLDY